MTVRSLRRLVAAALLGLLGLFASAPPAHAHSTGGLQPTNYETIVRGIVPAIRGIEVRSTDLGTYVELTNHTAHEVSILGYDGEPYLRVGPHGVFRNERSPAVYLNRTSKPTGGVPRAFDAAATPRWHRIASAPTVRWHDHRTHWMGSSDPPQVQRAGGSRHIVIPEWRVPLAVDGHAASIRGSVVWVPAEAPLFWLIAAVALAMLVVAMHRFPFWRSVMITTLALLVTATVVDVVGTWRASTATAGSKFTSSSYALMTALLGVAMIVGLLGSKWQRTVPAVLFAGFALFIVTGVGNIGLLFHSQLPTTAPDWVARTVVTVGLGAGVGLLIAAATRLKPDEITS